MELALAAGSMLREEIHAYAQRVIFSSQSVSDGMK